MEIRWTANRRVDVAAILSSTRQSGSCPVWLLIQQRRPHALLLFSPCGGTIGPSCNGAPPLQNTLHKVNIKYDYQVVKCVEVLKAMLERLGRKSALDSLTE